MFERAIVEKSRKIRRANQAIMTRKCHEVDRSKNDAL